MNKYIKHSLFCVMGAGLLASCDVMNTNPTESYDESTVWGSESTINGFVLGTYGDVLGNFTEVAKWESRTPNGTFNDFSTIDNVATETGINSGTDMGFNKFALLRRCNMIIEKTAQSTGISEAQKKELIAEGHFLRGMIFFAQARTIGRFVPITKVLTPEDKEAFATPLTKNVAESYRYVMEDLKKASTEMSETKISGRANRFVALALLSRAALQAYAYTSDAQYLTVCKNAAQEVIEKGGYKLSTDYKNLFLEPGAKDAEIIMARYYLDQNTTCGNIAEIINCVPNINPGDDLKWSQGSPALSPAPRFFEGWATYFPTQELVDQYLVIDQADKKPKVWYETSQYKTEVDEQEPSTLKEKSFFDKVKMSEKGIGGWDVPDKEDIGSNAKGEIIDRYGIVKDGSTAKINELMYNNRDNRFYGTIVYDSCVWLKGEIVTTCIQGNLYAGTRQYGKTSQYTSPSNYYWRKGIYDASPRVYGDNKTNYHYVISRLSEMYLNLAEVYLLENNAEKAVEMLNKTRVQHGMLPPSTAAAMEDAWKDYIRERRVEMAFENDAYWSYLRWGKYGGAANEGAAPNAVIKALDQPVHKVTITKDRKRFFTAQIVYSGAWNRNFTTKRYLFPIPKGHLDKRAASGIIDDYTPEW